jgi:hypothetical protein
MVPDKLAFISYKRGIGLNVRMGNNSYVPVQGRGSAIFALNGIRVLIRNVLHVPGLAVPLYSLRTHMSQRGCGFFGLASSGFLVYFPLFVLSVNTSVDCHLSFEPLGLSAPLDTLHYALPRCAPNYYPSEMSLSSSTASPSRVLPALIEDDVSPSPSSDSPSVCSESLAPPRESSDPIHESTAPPSPSVLVDLNSVSHQLQQLIATVGQICQVSLDSPHPAPLSSPDMDNSTAAQVPETSTPRLLSTLLADEIQCLIHTPGTSFPPVRPCDTANASDTKRTGPQRNSIALWVAVNFGITSIYCK